MPAATKTRRIVHQKAKGPVDPGVGRKVRELRTARGMTQAQLAGPDFSKGFISLLETGRTRVSLRAAHVLAGRLGVDVTDLLSTPTAEDQDLEFMLLRAEQSLRSGETKTAVEIAAKWAPKAGGVLRARFQRLQARALIRTTRSTEAVKLLDDALRTFRTLGAKDHAARTLMDLAHAHERLDSLGESLRFAMEAEHAIERGELVDRTLELEIHQFLAGVYMALGDMASAEIRAERARALAEDVADPYSVATTYAALALARFNEGDKEAALAYVRKSIDIYEALGSTEKVAETWNTLGWLFIRREQFGKAAEALDLSEKIAQENGITRLTPWIVANRGALALARGKPAEARELAEQAAATAREGVPRIRARSLLLRARAIAAGGGALPEVRRAFDEAVAAHKDENPQERARAHQHYADVLDERHQTADALAEARKALGLVGPRI
jgi:tetratricopeptide (TPR) repeat protein